MNVICSSKWVCLLCVLLCFGCQSNNSCLEKRQSVRSNVVKIQEKIVPFETDSILIGAFSRMYIEDGCLLITDSKSFSHQVYLFNKKNFRFMASTSPMGQGPDEITRIGYLATDAVHRRFYVSDHGKQKIFSYDLDSVLQNPFYKPSVKMNMDVGNFPTEYEYINDTLCIGRTILPVSVSDYVPGISRWNMLTGEMKLISYDHPDVKRKRFTYASSSKYGLALQLYTHSDLMTIVDFNGNLKCNVYGPQWNDLGSNHYYDSAVFCKSGKILASFSGGDYNREYEPTKLLVFDIDGNYIKTLEVGYRIFNMCYDEELNRLYLNFDDEIQFGYLDLDGLI